MGQQDDGMKRRTKKLSLNKHNNNHQNLNTTWHEKLNLNVILKMLLKLWNNRMM